jgi:hypothetical protein
MLGACRTCLQRRGWQRDVASQDNGQHKDLWSVPDEDGLLDHLIYDLPTAVMTHDRPRALSGHTRSDNRGSSTMTGLERRSRLLPLQW